MSADELVRRLFDAFNRRDVDAALPLLHHELIFEPITAAFLNDGEPYRGHEGIRLYFEHVTRHWHKLEINPVQIRAAGLAVVALGQTSGAGQGGEFSGVPTTWVFKFRDGVVAGIQIFSDERHARQALAREAEAASKAQGAHEAPAAGKAPAASKAQGAHEAPAASKAPAASEGPHAGETERML